MKKKRSRKSLGDVMKKSACWFPSYSFLLTDSVLAVRYWYTDRDVLSCVRLQPTSAHLSLQQDQFSPSDRVILPLSRPGVQHLHLTPTDCEFQVVSLIVALEVCDVLGRNIVSGSALRRVMQLPQLL